MNSKTRPGFVKRTAGAFTLAALLASLGTAPALAQEPVAPPAEGYDADTLQTLVGPIALYPDDLVAVILPAATYPLQIVQAARFLDEHQKDASLKPDPAWDDTIVALLNYPQVLKMMNENLNWTWSLGQAVLDSQAAVMDAIQGFRDRAYAAGNLRSDDHQTVSKDEEGAIEIQPANPEVVYVPYYEPQRVIVYQSVPVFHYYADPFPLYYYPYPAGYSFSLGFFWGVTSAFSIGWHTHLLNIYAPSYYGHPYYGHHYYYPYYARRGVSININLAHATHIWRPTEHHAARPLRRPTTGSGYVAHTERRDGTYSGRTRVGREPDGNAIRHSLTSRNAGTTATFRRAQPRAGLRDDRQRQPSHGGTTTQGTAIAPHTFGRVVDTRRAPRNVLQDSNRVPHAAVTQRYFRRPSVQRSQAGGTLRAPSYHRAQPAARPNVATRGSSGRATARSSSGSNRSTRQGNGASGASRPTRHVNARHSASFEARARGQGRSTGTQRRTR